MWGTVRQISPDGSTITILQDGRKTEYIVNGATRIMVGGAFNSGSGAERFAGIKTGDSVLFKPARINGHDVLIAIRLVPAGGFAAGLGVGPRAPMPKYHPAALKPLPELGAGKYHGFESGLYPGGANKRPAAHEKAGLALARQVIPLDAGGKPASAGRIVLLSLGMSNAMQASQGFARRLAGDAMRIPNSCSSTRPSAVPRLAPPMIPMVMAPARVIGLPSMSGCARRA